MFLLQIDPGIAILIYIASAVISLLIFYAIIKGAVKSAIIEARNTPNPQTEILTPELESLKKKYAHGHITFDQYQEQFNSLKNAK